MANVPQRPGARQRVALAVAAGVLTAASLLALPLAQFRPAAEVDWPDVAGEIGMAVLAMFWMIVLTRIASSQSVFRALSAGLVALYTGAVWDAMDEIAILPSGSLIENVGKLTGVALISVAFVLWWRGSQRAELELRARSARYQRMSMLDRRTELYNRQHFDDAIDELLPREEDDGPVALIMLDLDDFKVHNDTYGHPAGDVVIDALARIIRDGIRESDLPCRYGGEEFAVILPQATREVAAQVAERIRAAQAEQTFEPVRGEVVKKTVSLGVVEAKPGEDPQSVVQRCDDALYEAKRAGKDRVVTA